MHIAKIIDTKGREIFAEVRRIGTVLFDPRPGWVLLSGPLNAIARKREVFWMHPNDVRFVWIRRFDFAQVVELADTLP